MSQGIGRIRVEHFIADLIYKGGGKNKHYKLS